MSMGSVAKQYAVGIKAECQNYGLVRTSMDLYALLRSFSKLGVECA